jgi:hypothetical protein
MSFDILKHFGVLSNDRSGWKKEVNLVSWNGRNPKIAIYGSRRRGTKKREKG